MSAHTTVDNLLEAADELQVAIRVEVPLVAGAQHATYGRAWQGEGLPCMQTKGQPRGESTPIELEATASL